MQPSTEVSTTPLSVPPPAIDLSAFAKTTSSSPRVSKMAEGLVGSEILKIAAEIRQMIKDGKSICNLTVGDFDPKLFPIPTELKNAIVDAYHAGETNYPPSNGMPELRSAVQKFYSEWLGLNYPIESFLICGGARPVIYGVYRALVDAGDVVVCPTPSWNNNHYIHMVGAQAKYIPCGPESKFLPTKNDIVAALPGARLVCLNTPLNPTGTAMNADVVRAISEAMIDENRAREKRGERPCYLMYDHIYWMLTAKGTKHVTPPALVPEMAKYTIFVDGISKGFAATGVRVGWAVGPVDVIDRMSSVIGHVGAWAPRAEQVATARFLGEKGAIRSYIERMQHAVTARLDMLHAGFQSLKSDGFEVDSLSPEGAIYLTVKIFPRGKRTTSDQILTTNDDIRRFVLEHAGIGIVPFQAFGVTGDSGWFRLSVGAADLPEIEAALPRLRSALQALR